MRNHISDKEKIEIRNKAKLEIRKFESVLNDNETVQLLDSFKNKFNMCESVYKVILKEHQKSKGNDVDLKYLKLNMTQVPYALKFAGYTFDEASLNELFGNKSKKTGCKTVKCLRDLTTHGIHQKSIDEIKKRKKELFAYMDDFLEAIKNFDEEKTTQNNS